MIQTNPQKPPFTDGETVESHVADAVEPPLFPAAPPTGVSKTKISRNIATTTASQILSWGLTLVVTIFLPGYITAQGSGTMATAAAFAALFSVIVPFGTSQVVVKEIARQRRSLGEILSVALCLRGALFLVMALLMTAIGSIAYPDTIRALILVSALAIPINSINDACNAAIQGQEEMPKSNLFMLIERVVYAVLVLGMIHFRVDPVAGLWLFVAASPAAAAVQMALQLWNLRGVWKGLTLPRFAEMKALALMGAPFLGWLVFQKMYGATDALVLEKVTGNLTVVGWYAQAFRLIGTTLFFPTALATALLPTLARLHAAGDQVAFKRVARRGMDMVLLIGIPLAILFAVAAGPILRILPIGNTFAGAAPVLQFGGLSCLMYFIGCVLGTLVNAIDQQKQMFRVTMIAAIIGIPRCIIASWLAQKYWGNGAIGAVFSGAFLEMFMIYSYMKILPPGLFGRETLYRALRFVLAAAPMAVVLFMVAAHGWSDWWMLLCLPLYIVGLFVFRAVDRSDLIMLKEMFRLKGA